MRGGSALSGFLFIGLVVWFWMDPQGFEASALHLAQNFMDLVEKFFDFFRERAAQMETTRGG